MLELIQSVHVLAGVFILTELAILLMFGLRWPKEMVKEQPWHKTRS